MLQIFLIGFHSCRKRNVSFYAIQQWIIIWGEVHKNEIPFEKFSIRSLQDFQNLFVPIQNFWRYSEAAQKVTIRKVMVDEIKAFLSVKLLRNFFLIYIF